MEHLTLLALVAAFVGGVSVFGLIGAVAGTAAAEIAFRYENWRSRRFARRHINQ